MAPNCEAGIPRNVIWVDGAANLAPGIGNTCTGPAAAFGAGLTPGQDTAGIFESTADADFLGNLFHYDTANQTLYFSSDGTTASAITVAQFQSGVLLNAHDLLIV